jgi:hypothetical protein
MYCPVLCIQDGLWVFGPLRPVSPAGRALEVGLMIHTRVIVRRVLPFYRPSRDHPRLGGLSRAIKVMAYECLVGRRSLRFLCLGYLEE